MSLYTYAILTGSQGTDGSIKNWINDTRVPSTFVLAEAQAYIYSRLRVREMIATDQMTFAAGDSEHALPTGFQAPIWLKFHGDSDPLCYVHEQLLRRSTDEAGDLFEGLPSRWTIVGGEIWLDVKHEDGGDAEFVYLGTPADLSGANTTNFLTDRFPTVLLEACLMVAFRWKKDMEAMTAARLRCDSEIATANKTFDLARFTQNLMRG